MNALAMIAADPNVHPTFAQVLACNLAHRRAAYVEALKRFDWQHEHSDCQRTYSRGREELARLRAEQRVVDENGVLWGMYAPEGVRP